MAHELNQAREYFRTPQRKLFLTSFLLLSVLAFVVSLAGGQLHIIGYMQYAVLSSAVFGLALGLNKRDEATSASSGESCLVYLVSVVSMLCVFRFSMLGDLAIFPDADTNFDSLIVLSNESIHELITTSAIIALLHLNLRCFLFAGKLLSDVIGDGTKVDVMRTGLLAALSGIVLWTLLIAVGAPPVVGAGLILLLSLATLRPTRRQLVLGVLAAGIAATLAIPRQIPLNSQSAVTPFPTWSQITERASVPLLNDTKRIAIAVFTDGRIEQAAFDPSMSNFEWNRLQQSYGKLDLRDGAPGFFQIPFKVWPHPEKVLILGSGTGNYVAASLSHGATSVDAVESDPYALRVGLDHPTRPYADPRVATYCQDPRTFLMHSNKTYDLIVVAEPEGRQSASPFSPMRRNDLLYTSEAFKLMRERLSDKGYLAVAGVKYERWFMLRLVRNIIEVFEMADGGVLTTAGQYVFTSKHHPLDLEKTLATVDGAIVAPDTIGLNKDGLGAVPIIDEMPFPFTGLGTIPLSYLWCMYVLIAVMLLNLGPVASGPRASAAGEATRQSIRCIAWSVALILSVSCMVMLIARVLGTGVEVMALTTAGAVMLGLAAVTIAGKWSDIGSSHVAGGAAVSLALLVIALRAPVGYAIPVAALSLLPVLVCWWGICAVWGMGPDAARSRAFTIGGAAVGLVLTNLLLLVGTSGLMVIAVTVLLAGQFLPWGIILPGSRKEHLAGAGAGP